MDQDEALDKSYDATLLRRLLVYLRPYRGLTALAVVRGAGISLRPTMVAFTPWAIAL